MESELLENLIKICQTKIDEAVNSAKERGNRLVEDLKNTIEALTEFNENKVTQNAALIAYSNLWSSDVKSKLNLGEVIAFGSPLYDTLTVVHCNKSLMESKSRLNALLIVFPPKKEDDNG